jgi:hypothetical protein
MGACADKSNASVFRVNFVNEQPVSLNMTFTAPFPIAVKRMIPPFRGQGLFVDEQTHYLNKFVHIPAPLFRQCEFRLELAGTKRFKHSLTPQIFQ